MCSVAFAAIGMQAIGMAYQANAQKQAGAANQAIAEQNAKIAKAQEQQAYEKGTEQVDAYANNLKDLQGRAVAVAGANGIDPSSGSPLDLLVQSTRFGQKDLMTIANNASMEAFGYSSKAASYTAQGALEGFEGGQEATGTLLTGAGKLFEGGYQSGVFGPGGG